MNAFLKILDRFSFLVLIMGASFVFLGCGEKNSSTSKVGVLSSRVEVALEIIPGAENIAEYFSHLEGKRVGLVVNQTSRVGNVHLVDSLLDLGINIQAIFAPEHGFRGESDAGEVIKDGRDSKTNISVTSLYGKKKKPSQEDLSKLDVIIFDIQDVGARFYTYISSLHYVMEACSENNLPIIVLDRPNPNGHYVDGPVLDEAFKSFVGMHPVPVVYGMTIGEYAQMINGEGWLENGQVADLTVIPVRNYDHSSYYTLPVRPSPNLPNIRSILLYPSLCFFEGTHLSEGRGTNQQFQIFGHPKYPVRDFSFTPVSMDGAKYPKHENVKCYGKDLSKLTIGSLFERKTLDISYLLETHNALKAEGEDFFLDSNFFDKLAGTDNLRRQIEAGKSEDEIRASWKEGLDKFNEVRQKYLIYD